MRGLQPAHEEECEGIELQAHTQRAARRRARVEQTRAGGGQRLQPCAQRAEIGTGGRWKAVPG